METMITLVRVQLLSAMLAFVVCSGEFEKRYESDGGDSYGSSGGSYDNGGGSYGSNGGSYSNYDGGYGNGGNGDDTNEDGKGGKAFTFVSFLDQFDFVLQIGSPIVIDLGGFAGRRRRSSDVDLWNLDQKRTHRLAKMEAILSTVSNENDTICNEFIICNMMNDLESSRPLGTIFAKFLFEDNDDVPVRNATRASALGRWQRYLAAAKQGLDSEAECESSYPTCSGSLKDFQNNPVFSVLRFLGSFIGLNIIT